MRILATRMGRVYQRRFAPRYDLGMTALKRSTIYFDPKIHRAVRRKAAAADSSISNIVNEAVRRSLLEDLVHSL